MSFQRVVCVMALLGVMLPHRAALAQAIEDAVIASMAATHEELPTITIKQDAADLVSTFAMTSDGRLMASISRWSQEPATHEIVFYSPEGETLETWDMTEKMPPRRNWYKGKLHVMLHGSAEGDIYVGGAGWLMRFNAEGDLLQELDYRKMLAEAAQAEHAGKSQQDQSEDPPPDALAFKRVVPAGITSSAAYLFVALHMDGGGTRSTQDVYRFSRELGEPLRIIENLRGCCAHIDLETLDNDKLVVAENTRFRINTYTFAGTLLGRWGKRSRTSIEGFASCCNPVGICFAPDGELITASSGVGRVKRYTPEGEFLGMVALVNVTRWEGAIPGKCYIPIEVSPDNQRVYVLDEVTQNIHVMKRR